MTEVKPDMQISKLNLHSLTTTKTTDEQACLFLVEFQLPCHHLFEGMSL